MANVSVNRTDLMVSGRRVKLIQLGTVMTAPAYRNRGLIRYLMAQIEADHKDVDGIYLFANDSVLDFYPKFGFRRGVEYGYSRQISQTGSCEMEQVPMDTPQRWAVLADAMARSGFADGVWMVDNPGLIFFYVSQFMRENVYHCPRLDAWVIAEPEGSELTIHNIFAPKNVTVDDCVAAFGEGFDHVTLGFAPADNTGYHREILREEDTTLFVKGKFFDEFQQKKLRIPTLSHA